MHDSSQKKPVWLQFWTTEDNEVASSVFTCVDATHSMSVVDRCTASPSTVAGQNKHHSCTRYQAFLSLQYQKEPY